jgi:hypothetical protein
MATPPSDDTRTMFRLLADGEWHSYAKIKAEIAKTVPPGRALRKYQERLRQNRELRNDPNTEIIRSEDDQIRLGAAACAQITMTSWKGRGIIVRGEGPTKQCKIRPGFKSWGLEQPTPAGESQDPSKEPGGYTEVPPSDSDPPEAARATGEEASEPNPAAAVEASAEPAIPDDVIPEIVQGEPTSSESSQYVTNIPVMICPECFMAVTDLAGHEQWHLEIKSSQASPEALAVIPDTLKGLVEDVMRQVLDEFQLGMQDWFTERFAELERQMRLLRRPQGGRTPWLKN